MDVELRVDDAQKKKLIIVSVLALSLLVGVALFFTVFRSDNNEILTADEIPVPDNDVTTTSVTGEPTALDVSDIKIGEDLVKEPENSEEEQSDLATPDEKEPDSKPDVVPENQGTVNNQGNGNESDPATTSPSTTAPVSSASNPTYQGVRDFNSFSQGTQQFDAWTNGDIAFYAPAGQVPQEVGLKWVEWYRRVDDLYRQMSTKENFETVYRRDDPNFGRKKVLGIVTTCGAGCGSKQQAEADPGYIESMLANPDDPGEHWIFYYEMGRTGSASFFEDFYGRATWPTNTLIVPHMMAALAFYELGGQELLRGGNTKFLFEELDRWEAADIEYVDQFPIPDQQTQNDYTSHHLIPAMLLEITVENDYNTLESILENMSNEPKAENATQAMCDFQDAVNAATSSRYSARMKGEWGLPDNCP